MHKLTKQDRKELRKLITKLPKLPLIDKDGIIVKSDLIVTGLSIRNNAKPEDIKLDEGTIFLFQGKSFDTTKKYVLPKGGGIVYRNPEKGLIKAYETEGKVGLQKFVDKWQKEYSELKVQG